MRPRLQGSLSRFVFVLVGAALATGASRHAPAESKWLLESPADAKSIVASTFDESGHEVGRSTFELESAAFGVQHMKIELAVAQGGVNRSEATFVRVGHDGPEKDLLRLTAQRSQATRADGVSLDLLVIDHVEGRASCYASDEVDPVGRHIELPEDDRVVNVPLQLLFKPLARGEIDKLRFQFALCRSGPVIQNMLAVRGSRSRKGETGVIEIRFGPDFGETVAWFASRLLPSFSFWFDESEGDYLGHKMPLHRKGPTILLVRQGLLPPDLGLAMY